MPCPSIILNFIIYRTTEKTIVSVESPSMEKKIVNTPLLLPKASAINEKSKNSPSSKNLKMEENIQLKPLQPVLKRRYGFIFALYRGSPLSTNFGTWGKIVLVKFVLVGTTKYSRVLTLS